VHSRGIGSTLAPPAVRAALLVALAAGGFASSPAQADLLPIDADPDSALALALAQVEGDPLSLDDAIRSALERATTVVDARAALEAAHGARRRERGAFDPELFGEIRRTHDEAPTASPFSGADVLVAEEHAATAGARVRLPIGTEVTASLTSSRLTTNSVYASLVPEYDADGLVEIRQPLLKGFGPAARSALSSAERDAEAAESRYEDAVLSVRADVERAYWDLYAAERDFAVQRLIRDRAEALLSEIRLRAQAGIVGPSHVATARVFLADQEQFLLDREEHLDATSDALATLLGRRPGGGLARFRPKEHPPRDVAVAPHDSVVARTLRASRALHAAERDVAAARARARGARWDALPALDVFGSIGGAGLAGSAREVVFGTDTLRTDIDGDRTDSWRQVVEREFPSWSAGVRMSVPIGLRSGRAERDRLAAEVVRAEQALDAARRAAEETARAAHREMLHAARRLQVAEGGVDASLEQVRIGVLEYRVGRTTAFELVRLGADLAAAQQRYSQALVRAAKAAAELKRLTAEGLTSEADGG
jgi:outer membrane protein TolC